MANIVPPPKITGDGQCKRGSNSDVVRSCKRNKKGKIKCGVHTTEVVLPIVKRKAKRADPDPTTGEREFITDDDGKRVLVAEDKIWRKVRVPTEMLLPRKGDDVVSACLPRSNTERLENLATSAKIYERKDKAKKFTPWEKSPVRSEFAKFKARKQSRGKGNRFVRGWNTQWEQSDWETKKEDLVKSGKFKLSAPRKSGR